MRSMQGTFAHVFAAAMAVTVIYFPSPQDFYAKIMQFAASEQIAASFPNLKTLGLNDTKIAYLGEHAQLAETCAVAGMPSAWAHDCGSDKPVLPEQPKLTPRPIRIAFGPEEEELVAGRMLCQALWAEAVASRRQFDAQSCLPA